MKEKVLVAGATGRLGRGILAEAREAGYKVRALVRDPMSLGGYRQYADEIFSADAREISQLKDVCAGVNVVISALGASLNLGLTRDGATFQTVDYQANLNLLRAAQVSGVSKFVYVSLCGGPNMRGVAYADAHEAFVSKLQNSGLPYTVVRPTGFFYLFAEIWKMAQRGVMPLMGNGEARTNPIDERELARFCVEAIAAKELEKAVGGPESFRRRDIATLAARSTGRRVRFLQVPAGVMRTLIKPVRWVDQRLYETLDFGVYINTVEVVAPAYGTRTLSEFFAGLAQTNGHLP